MKKWIAFTGWATVASIPLAMVFFFGVYVIEHYQDWVNLYKHAVVAPPGQSKGFPFYLVNYFLVIAAAAWGISILRILANAATKRAIDVLENGA